MKMNLRLYRTKVEALASTPKELCWVHHDEHGDSENDYCYDCALVAIDKLTKSEETAREFCKDPQNPDWGLCEKDDVRLIRSQSYESDGCRHCATCGAHLDISLLRVRSELEHFQEHVTEPDPDGWAHWLDVLVAIEYAERSKDPKEKDLYEQVLKETRRLLNEEGGR